MSCFDHIPAFDPEPRKETLMGHNDHVPVPDPTPRVRTPEKVIPRPHGTVMLPPTDNRVEVPMTSSKRLDSLEKSRERYDAQAVSLRNSIVEISTGMANLTRLLRQTVRGIERLGQGHSIGNLGLPTVDDWQGIKP